MQLLPDTLVSRTASAVTAFGPWVGAVVCASLLGCGSIGSQLVANNGEYLAYREVRTSERLDARLAASSAYLSAHPDGQWAQEVRPWFERAELRYWLRIKETPAGLASYLETLPDGPHAAEATALLAAYRERQEAARKELLDLSAAMTEERLAELAKQREVAQEAFVSWLGRFLAIESWGKRTSELDHEFIFAWRIDPPHGTCVDDRCAKLVQYAYELPGGGEQSERRLVMDVVVQLDQGMVEQAKLEGPGLFSRLYEAGAKQPVPYDDPSARVEAIAYAVEVIGGAVEARMPAQRCALDTVAPVVLHRSCDGWTVTVTAAEQAGEDDVVSISGPASP